MKSMVQGVEHNEDQSDSDGVDTHEVDVITRAWKEAIALGERGEIRLAISMLRSTGLVALRSGEAERLRAAQIKLDLAALYIDDRMVRKALCFARSGLRGLERWGGADRSIAEAHNTIANSFSYQRDPLPAIQHYDEALRYYSKSGCEPDDLARVHTNKAICLSQIGQIEEAGKTLKTALSLGPSPQQRAVTEYQLAAYYERTGKIELALQTFEGALLHTSAERVPEVLDSIAILKDRLGQSAVALEFSRKAVAVAASLPKVRHKMINVVCNHAQQAASLGYTDEARRSLRMAVRWSARTRTPQDVHTILNARTAVAGFQGTPRSQVGLLRRLEAANLAMAGEGDPTVLFIRAHLAELTSKRDPAKGFEQLFSAIERCPAPPFAPYMIVARAALAFRALQMNRFEVAGALARELLMREAGIGMPELRWRVIAIVACSIHASGAVDAAILLMKIAAEAARQLLLQTPDLATYHETTELRTRVVYRNLVAWLVAAGRFPEAEQLHLAERATGSGIVRGQADVGAANVITPMTERELQAAEQMTKIGVAWRDEVTAAERAGREVIAGDLNHPRAREMEAWLAETTAFRMSRREADPIGFLPFPGGPGDVMLHYVVADGRVHAIARSHMKEEMRVELAASEDTINAACFDFRQAILNRTATVDTLGCSLFDMIIRPVWSLVGTARCLHVVPDGAMRYLPFCALRSEVGYLIESFPIQYVPVVAAAQKPQTERRVWKAACMGTSVLPHARAELDAIPRANTGTILFDAPFDRNGFSAALGSKAEIIHIASHFRLDPANVELSSLELGDGSRMLLEEFRERRFDFSHVELLILSACDTGTVAIGKTHSESLAGLFQIQGARRVMATLWPVADDSAAELTSNFYRLAFADGGECPLSEALREAQLSMIRSKMPWDGDASKSRGGFALAHAVITTRHPYFWASHVLYAA